MPHLEEMTVIGQEFIELVLAQVNNFHSSGEELNLQLNKSGLFQTGLGVT